MAWSDAHRAARDDITRSYGDAPLWGFKDPRTLLVLDFRRKALPNITFVGTFRHPALVAASLCLRDGGKADHWLSVWAHYNMRLLALHETSPFPIIQFDLDDDVYGRSLTRIIDQLGLYAPLWTEFFDPELRHHETTAMIPLPEPISRLHDALRAIALDPER